MVMQASDLRVRVTFSKRAAVDDGYGSPVSGAFVEQFTVAARVATLRGGEEVLAERLTGRQPVLITVRPSENTRQITTDWRAHDALHPTRVWNIRAITPDERSRQIDFLCEAGVAV